MAAFNFPNSPSTNDTHSENNVTWKWDGTMWNRISDVGTTLTHLNVTGISTLGGNVQIGGVLTYEDVKNVDSVGIVTARQGIKIPDDNKSILLGTSDDMRIRHTGNHSEITDEGTGSLRLGGNQVVIGKPDFSETSAVFIEGAGATLKYANVAKFETASSGVNIVGTTTTGQLAVTGVTTFTGAIDANSDLDVDGHTNLDNVSISGVTTTGGNVNIAHGTGQAHYQITQTNGNTVKMGIVSGSDFEISGSSNNDIILKRAGSAKLTVTSTGISVTGIPVATQNTGNIGLELHATGSGRGSQTKYHNDHGEAYVGTAGDTTGDLLIHNTSNTNILFATNNTPRARITSTGNLLVGATAVEDWDGSRDHRIQVRGNTYQTAGISILDTQNDDNSGELVIGKSRGTGNTIVGSADDIGQIRFAANDGAGFHSIAWVRASMDGTPGSDDLPSNLRFGTSADGGTTVTERLRINSSGEVSIGTVSGGKTLTLYGASSSSFRISKSGVLAYDHTFDGSTYTIANNNGSAGIPIIIGTKTGGGESLRIHENGAISAGVDNDSYELTLQGKTGGAPTLWLRDGTTSGTPRIIFGDTGNALQGSIYYHNNGDYMTFSTNGSTEKLRITSQGRVNIGEANLTQTATSLSVTRNAGGTVAGESVIAATCGDNTTMISALLTVRNAGNRGSKGHGAGSKLASFEFNDHKALTITKDGRVGIGTDSATGTLEVVDTGDYQLILKDNNNAGPGAEMAMGFKDSGNTIQGWIGFNRWEDDDFHTGNGNSGGHICFHTHNGSAVGERLRIDSSGRIGINTSDGRFNNSNSASSNKFNQNDPKLGIHGSIAIGNLSSTATDIRELAFYRRGGPTPGTSISNHHMGRVAWYGSSNDTAFPDMAWSLDCTANGGGWTAGSNRHGYLSFVSGRNGEYMRLTSSGYLSVGFAGAPDTRVHIKGNSDNGAADATVTIEDSDTTAGSREPILAFDGNGTRQGRIMSSDTNGMYFSTGSSNNTVIQLTDKRDLYVHANSRSWATMQLGNIRYHCRQHYAPGNAVTTQSLMRVKRYWWGWGTYKITAKLHYYGSHSGESTFFLNGHGNNDSYSIKRLDQSLTGGGDNHYGSSSLISITSPSNSSPGNSTTSFVDVQINIPNYTYAIIIMECMSSQYTTDPTNIGNDGYCLL